MNNTYKLTHTVGYSEVDSYYKLRLDYIFSHFQNIAGLHSIEMGTDGEKLLAKSNALWVLTKMKLRIAELPRFGETITVETWPLKAKGVRFDRDFVLKGKEKPLLMGSSEWCTLDFTTHKLRKVESVDYPHNMPFREDRSGAGEWIRVKESVCDTNLHHIHRSAFVDVDSNKHTNNVAYLRMVLNCFTPDEFEALRIDEHKNKHCFTVISCHIISSHAFCFVWLRLANRIMCIFLLFQLFSYFCKSLMVDILCSLGRG